MSDRSALARVASDAKFPWFSGRVTVLLRMAKPAVFIGSSTEGLEFARAVRSQLDPDAEVTLWNDEGTFKLGETFIESLINALPRFDFAILLLTPDDLIASRSQDRFGPRDKGKPAQAERRNLRSDGMQPGRRLTRLGQNPIGLAKSVFDLRKVHTRINQPANRAAVERNPGVGSYFDWA